MSTNNFFSLYRKKGCGIVLNLLKENPIITEFEFFKLFKKNDKYQNTFYRIKEMLLSFGLINYDLTPETFEKRINLTEKGIKILSLIEKINETINE